MDYLPHDYDVDQANRDALETWDRASEAGPPEHDDDTEPTEKDDELPKVRAIPGGALYARLQHERRRKS